eukprot:SAG31_NODE_8367_length_1464_cov_6.503297_1_plen_126_part_00
MALEEAKVLSVLLKGWTISSVPAGYATSAKPHLMAESEAVPRAAGIALVGGWDGKSELASAKLGLFDDSAKGMHWVDLPELPGGLPLVNAAVVGMADGSLIVAGELISHSRISEIYHQELAIFSC